MSVMLLNKSLNPICTLVLELNNTEVNTKSKTYLLYF